MLPSLDRQYRDAPDVLAAPDTVLGRCFFLLWLAFLGIRGRQYSTNQTAPVKKSPVASRADRLLQICINLMHPARLGGLIPSPEISPKGTAVGTPKPFGLPGQWCSLGGLLQTRGTGGSAAHQPGTGNTGFRHLPAEPHIRLNVRYGSKADLSVLGAPRPLLRGKRTQMGGPLNVR